MPFSYYTSILYCTLLEMRLDISEGKAVGLFQRFCGAESWEAA
jgi:hypothetical protein